MEFTSVSAGTGDGVEGGTSVEADDCFHCFLRLAKRVAMNSEEKVDGSGVGKRS